jgi:putative sigma-54 modulation protein
VHTIVKGRNIEIPDADRSYAEQKLRRLERLLDDRSEAVLELSVERHRDDSDTRIADVTLVIHGQPMRGVGRASTHRAAIDQVMDRLERQTVERKERPLTRKRPATGRRPATESAASRARTPDPAAADGETPRVVKVKRFAIEPMFEEDAVARMQELGHNFFVFVNAENEHLGVLYRRNDGDYGLIEPAIGGLYTTGKKPAGAQAVAVSSDVRRGQSDSGRRR